MTKEQLIKKIFKRLSYVVDNYGQTKDLYNDVVFDVNSLCDAIKVSNLEDVFVFIENEKCDYELNFVIFTIKISCYFKNHNSLNIDRCVAVEYKNFIN